MPRLRMSAFIFSLLLPAASLRAAPPEPKPAAKLKKAGIDCAKNKKDPACAEKLKDEAFLREMNRQRQQAGAQFQQTMESVKESISPEGKMSADSLSNFYDHAQAAANGSVAAGAAPSQRALAVLEDRRGLSIAPTPAPPANESLEIGPRFEPSAVTQQFRGFSELGSPISIADAVLTFSGASDAAGASGKMRAKGLEVGVVVPREQQQDQFQQAGLKTDSPVLTARTDDGLTARVDVADSQVAGAQIGKTMKLGAINVDASGGGDPSFASRQGRIVVGTKLGAVSPEIGVRKSVTATGGETGGTIGASFKVLNATLHPEASLSQRQDASGIPQDTTQSIGGRATVPLSAKGGGQFTVSFKKEDITRTATPDQSSQNVAVTGAVVVTFDQVGQLAGRVGRWLSRSER